MSLLKAFLLLGALALGGCSTVTVLKIPIPEALLEECRVSSPEIRTNGDLARAYLGAREELLECAARQDAVRGWARAQTNSKK